MVCKTDKGYEIVLEELNSPDARLASKYILKSAQRKVA